MKTIIFGASGMVGEGVLIEALKHPAVESILVIGRRSCGIRHPKLKEILHSDFFDYATLEKELTGYDACFFCLGVSSVGMKQEQYHHLTYDLTMAAASTLARLNPGMTFSYVSGTGTDSSEQGRTMWARVKGKTENHLAKLPFKRVFSFRPGFINPVPGQTKAYGISKVLSNVYPALKAVFPAYVCTLQDLAAAMIAVSDRGYEKQILENPDIRILGARSRDRG